MRKLLTTLVAFTLLGVAVIGGVRITTSESREIKPVDTQAVAAAKGKPGDLSGDWITKADARVKFTAEIQAGTILIHMIEKGDALAYYYGTFTTADEYNVFHSKAIDDGKFVWSNSKEKDFLWQKDKDAANDSLIFEYRMPGIVSHIQLVRDTK